jgi:hypothetical protein
MKDCRKFKVHPSLTILGGWLCQSLTQGVGTNNFTKTENLLQEYKPQGNFPGACYNARMKEERLGVCYPIKGGAFGVLCDRKWAA